MIFEIYIMIRFISEINVIRGEIPSFSFIPWMLKETGHIYQRNIHDQELRLLQYLGYHENILMVLS